MKSPRSTAWSACAARTGLLAALVSVSCAGLFASAASAELQTIVGSMREVTTLSTQAHPQKIELAYMVMERQKIAEASIEYLLDRWNWGPVELENGGKMIGTLKVFRESGTQTVGRKQSAKCQSQIREDELGSFNERVCGLYWEDDLDLEPGDVVVWTIKFKKMPKLEYEPFDDTVYRDRFTLSAMLLPPV